jgi:hypothetical protein
VATEKTSNLKTKLGKLGGRKSQVSPKPRRRLLSKMSINKRVKDNKPLGALAARGGGQTSTNWQGMDTIKVNRMDSQENILEEKFFELGEDSDRPGSEKDLKNMAALKGIMIQRPKNTKAPDRVGAGKRFQIKPGAGRSVSTLRPAKATLQVGNARSASPGKHPLSTKKNNPTAIVRSKREPEKPPEVKKIVPPMGNPMNPTQDQAKVMGIQSQLTQKSIGVSKFTNSKKTKEDMLTRADTNFESPFFKTAPMPKTNVALNLTQPFVFPGGHMGLKTMAKKPRNFGSNFTNSEIISKLENDRQISNTLGVAVDFVAKKAPEPNSPSD